MRGLVAWLQLRMRPVPEGNWLPDITMQAHEHPILDSRRHQYVDDFLGTDIHGLLPMDPAVVVRQPRALPHAARMPGGIRGVQIVHALPGIFVLCHRPPPTFQMLGVKKSAGGDAEADVLRRVTAVLGGHA